MNEAKILIYDGSFNGYLTAVFHAFEQKLAIVDIQKEENAQSGLFSDAEVIYTDIDKAKRVWNGIQNKNDSAIKNIYFAFMSEESGIELLLFQYIKTVFSSEAKLYLNFTDQAVLKVNQLAKSVSKEKYHIESFLRFNKMNNDTYRALISPENDILPLISKHFRSQYANQKWLIYDAKRKYGLYYDLNSITKVYSDNTTLITNYNNTIVMQRFDEKLTA
jgi:probable DNA metabolism protein